MKTNKMTASEVKALYESPVIEIITLSVVDILTTSGFPGEDDIILQTDNY